MHDEKKSVVSQATTIKIRKKNSVLKKNRKIAEKKIPRQIFVDKIFRCLLKSTKQNMYYDLKKKFLRPLLQLYLRPF